MKQQQQPTATISFDFTFRPVKTSRKTILLEEHLKDFRILNFVNDNANASICKIYFENEDALRPFLKHLSPNLYDVYSVENELIATILIFQKNNVLNYTVKSTILNIENIKIEKQKQNLI